MIRLKSADAIMALQSTSLRPGSLTVIEDTSAFAECKLLDACVEIARSGARCLIKANFGINGENPYREFCSEMRFEAQYLYSEISEDGGGSWTPKWGVHASSVVPTLFVDDSPTIDVRSLDAAVSNLQLDVLTIMEFSSILADKPDKVTYEFHPISLDTFNSRMNELARRLNVAIVAFVC